MKRQGRVRRLYEDGTALVIVTAGCAMECDQCGQCRRGEEGFVAQNPEEAQPGELVLIRTHPEQVLLAAVWLLILPIVSFFAGYWLGAALWCAGKVTGCLAFTLSIGIGHRCDRLTASRCGSGYTIIKYPQNINKGDNGFD